MGGPRAVNVQHLPRGLYRFGRMYVWRDQHRIVYNGLLKQSLSISTTNVLNNLNGALGEKTSPGYRQRGARTNEFSTVTTARSKIISKHSSENHRYHIPFITLEPRTDHHPFSCVGHARFPSNTYENNGLTGSGLSQIETTGILVICPNRHGENTVKQTTGNISNKLLFTFHKKKQKTARNSHTRYIFHGVAIRHYKRNVRTA